MRADKQEVERRGALGCNNSDYHIRRTTCCNSCCVEDEELHNLFFDTKDLTKKVPLWNEEPCPVCGSAVWDLLDVDTCAAVSEAWRWACPNSHS
jgi:hypothetical protein